MVDDILSITTCSSKFPDSIEHNAAVNSKIESKNLQLSDKKCYKIHIDKKKSYNMVSVTYNFHCERKM